MLVLRNYEYYHVDVNNPGGESLAKANQNGRDALSENEEGISKKNRYFIKQ